MLSSRHSQQFIVVTCRVVSLSRGRVITRKSVGRGVGSDSIFGANAAQKGVYLEGLDASVDQQLLSRCDFLVHSRSIFTEGALLTAGPSLRQHSCLLSDPVPSKFLSI